MTDDSHAARNAAMLRRAESENSRAVVRSHNNLVGAVEAVETGVATAHLDEAQVDRLDDALDELAGVAESLRDNDRLLEHHERLLASPERGSR